MRAILFSVFILLYYSLSAQVFSLDDFLMKCEANYPLANQHSFIDASTDLKLKNLNALYYPQFDLTGQMTWQNDVPHVEVGQLPFNMPQAPKDQYKAYVDFKQMIFDGGLTMASKEVERNKSNVEHHRVKVDIYGIRSGIINSYFLVLMLDEQMKQLDYITNNLEERQKEVEVLVNNGVLLLSNLDVLKVEILKLKQNRYGIEEARKAAIAILSEYSGEMLSDSIRLAWDSTSVVTNGARPELALFDAQRQQLSATNNLMAKKRMPKLMGFGQAGYGNPGFNMLLDSFEPFYMVGVRLNWNIWDWKMTANERQILDKQSDILSTQEETFLKNIKIGSLEIQSRIRKMEKMIETDHEIIDLRKRITNNSKVQLKNGVIMASDYISDLNNEAIARLSHTMHKIELNKAQRELINLLGSNL
ncbi:MAG: TolC family protein [Marinilabiliaceae bacterium]|nr:TolC family protein [Marinilabiliaceae bacterium]